MCFCLYIRELAAANDNTATTAIIGSALLHFMKPSLPSKLHYTTFSSQRKNKNLFNYNQQRYYPYSIRLLFPHEGMT